MEPSSIIPFTRIQNTIFFDVHAPNITTHNGQYFIGFYIVWLFIKGYKKMNLKHNQSNTRTEEERKSPLCVCANERVKNIRIPAMRSL